MNIGIFSDTYFPQLNGVATSIQTLAAALEQRGHQVYIFTPSDPRCYEGYDTLNVQRLIIFTIALSLLAVSLTFQRVSADFILQ